MGGTATGRGSHTTHILPAGYYNSRDLGVRPGVGGDRRTSFSRDEEEEKKKKDNNGRLGVDGELRIG
jgi:hypothetical protein